MPLLSIFIADFRPFSSKFIYLICSEDEKERQFVIKDIQYLQKENLTENLCSGINELLIKEKVNLSGEGFFIRVFGITPEFHDSLNKELRKWLTKTLESQRVPFTSGMLAITSDEGVITEGAKKAIDILTLPSQLDKRLLVKHDFIFGIQLDAEKIFEIIPKDFTLPYERKKAFKVEGAPEGITVNLYCGFSDRVDSGIRIASIQAKPPDGSFRQRQMFEFIASIRLEDRTRGTFEVILPQGEVQAQKFKVPVIME